MLNRIIRIAAAACALLIWTGCAATLDPAQEGTTLPISFDAGSMLLREDATKSTLAPGTTFGVFAFLQPGTVGSPGTWNGSRTPNFMYNVPVYYNGSTYTYSPLRYWPEPQNTISFWAYCPYTANPDFLRKDNTTGYTNTTGDIPDIRFSVSDGTVDLMTTDILKSQTMPVDNGPVLLTFNHVLSLIDINVNKQDAESRFIVKLKSVRFDGIYLTGIHRRNGGWKENELSNIGSFTVFSGNQTLLTSPSYALDGVMLIPQDLSSDDAKLHVEFSITPSGGGTERPSACDVALSEVFEDASFKWEKNKHYTLTLTVAPNDPIEFSVEWSDWGSVYNWHITS